MTAMTDGGLKLPKFTGGNNDVEFFDYLAKMLAIAAMQEFDKALENTLKIENSPLPCMACTLFELVLFLSSLHK